MFRKLNFRNKEYKDISIEEAVESLDNNANDILLLDVRTAAEFEQGYISGSRLIPVQSFSQRLTELEKYKDKDVMIICRSGSRSRVVASYLSQSGFTKVTNIVGGIIRWYQSGFPLETPSSLHKEQQFAEIAS